MRQLPRNKTPKHNQIISAVDDFFGEGCPPADRKLKKDICLWLMKRKRGVSLIEEQKEIVEIIKINLSDPLYRESLSFSL